LDNDDPLTERVLGAVFEVANTLGAGFLEKVYERALLKELTDQGLHAASQVPFSVLYKGHNVGDYLADLVVESTLLVELKCVDALTGQHIAQCLNYLKASSLTRCLLVNFQKPKVEWKRLIL
jgi:GxxExxY protein